MSSAVQIYLSRDVAKEVLRGLNEAYADVSIAKCVWEERNGLYTSECKLLHQEIGSEP